MRSSIIVAVSIILVAPGPSCTNSDNLALLAGTLKTMHKAACDDEMVSLSCPRGTSISIQVAQYGKAAPDGHSCIAEPVQDQDLSERCLWPNSMQYSLLQTVVEACQKKPACKFSTKSKPEIVDPCPHARKFVEVAYKCRPHEFRSRTGCENDVIQLSCNPFSRLAIFSAQYGRTAYESDTCPQTQGVPDQSCTASYVVENVMQICHGRRRCHIVVNSKTFGSPCKPHTKTLNVVYACVPLGVLTERYESPVERDEVPNTRDVSHDGGFEESDTGERWGETLTRPVPAVADSALLPPIQEILQVPQDEEVIEVTSKPRHTKNFEKSERSRAHERFYLYIGAAIIILIILISLILTIRFYVNRKRKRIAKNGNMFTTEAPNVFNDNVSDIDNEGSLSHISGTFYDPAHPDMIYGARNLRPMKPLSTIYPTAGASMYGVDYVQRETVRFDNDVEVLSPKSLRGYTNTQFNYG